MSKIGRNEETNEEKLLLCPICNAKTRTKAYAKTVLSYFPLFCPKCKKETVVNVKQLNITVINGYPKEIGPPKAGFAKRNY